VQCRGRPRQQASCAPPPRSRPEPAARWRPVQSLQCRGPRKRLLLAAHWMPCHFPRPSTATLPCKPARGAGRRQRRTPPGKQASPAMAVRSRCCTRRDATAIAQTDQARCSRGAAPSAIRCCTMTRQVCHAAAAVPHLPCAASFCQEAHWCSGDGGGFRTPSQRTPAPAAPTPNINSPLQGIV
jgi:hypothetical protein